MAYSKNSERQYSATENRTWQRLHCNIDTVCYTLKERWHCRIVDLSERGIGVVLTSSIKEGTIVNFLDPETKAQVIWCHDNKAGLRIIH